MTKEEADVLDFALEATQEALVLAWQMNQRAAECNRRINEIMDMPMYEFTMHAGEIPELNAEMADLDNKINIILKTAETTHKTARKFIDEKV